jgi:hypothetical protein
MRCVKYWEIIADNLSQAGWSWGCVSAWDSEGRTIWIADAAPYAEANHIAQEEIKQIEHERNEALLKDDAATLDRMTSDEYTFINQRGELRTKAEIVAGKAKAVAIVRKI